MGRKSRRKRSARRSPGVPAPPPPPPRERSFALAAWLGAREPEGPPWRWFPWILALAFVARAAVALSGDFVLHPDEIMQYLESAHRLVFGNGVVFWEFLYGARFWLVPGFVAGILALFDAVGLGEPVWYVGGVKLAFCAVSLLIPAGMYFFARRQFGETAGRIALVTGAFWYELVGFAHKPMTEFVSTALLLVLLALCARPSLDRTRTIWAVAALATLMAAVRLQYAPLALPLLGVAFLRTRRKAALVSATGLCLLAVGILDGASWGGSLFHSYVTNIEFNLFLGDYRAGESPGWQYLLWLVLASSGLGALCLAAAAPSPRRYGILLALIAIALLAHSLQSHKEYRFIFAVIPLWLLIGSDMVARIMARTDGAWRVPGLAAAAFAVLSVAGILNALPSQAQVYHAYSRGTGFVRFLSEQDPAFAAYRYLARAPDVQAVLHTDRHHHNLPGYYYLHRKVPFYDILTGSLVAGDGETLRASVSHIVSMEPGLQVQGYRLDRAFGDLRILRREADEPEIRRWERYAPVMVSVEANVVRQFNPAAPLPPPRWGIRFQD